jgi:hypothetical protein
MKYNLRYTGEFKRSLKRCLKRGYDEQLLTDVLKILATEGRLPEKYNPHILHGQYEGYWECHNLQLASCMGPKRQRFGVDDDEYRHSFRPVRKE